MKVSVKKAVADARAQPVRALLLVAAITVGTAAVMTAAGARTVLNREVAASFERSAPAAVILWTDNVDDELLAIVRRVPGVTGAEARKLVRARALVAPGDWRSLLIYAVRDLEEIEVSRVFPVEGAWPPAAGAALVETSARSVLGLAGNGPLKIRLPGTAAVQSVEIVGVAHDPAQAPGWQDNLGYLYVEPAALRALGVDDRLDQLRVAIRGDRDDAGAAAALIERAVRDAGHAVHRVEVPPRKHPHTDHMQTMLMLLLVMAALSLLLSALLTTNLFSALLARQTRQVGVLKTVGASPAQIGRIYLYLVACLAAPAVLVGVALGVFAGRRFAVFAGQQLNLYEPSTALPLWVVVGIALLSLAVPVAAAAVPITRAARVPVRAALQDVGIAPPSRRRLLGAAGARVSWTFALRNSLRRRARFALTLASLAVGGAMLLTAANVYGSLIGAVDASLEARADDIDLRLRRPAPSAELLSALGAVDGVARVEVWGAALAGFQTPGVNRRVAAGRYGVLAPPEGRRPKSVKVVEGRWPSKAAGAVEIAVNHQLAALEPWMRLGAKTTILLGGRATDALIVGLVEEIAPAAAYTTPAGMARFLGKDGLAGGARIELEAEQDPAAVAAALEEVVVGRGWFPVYRMTKVELKRAMVDHFLIILIVLIALAHSAVCVGTLGLATTMSINVLERQRELGVLKAVGATAGAVRAVVLLEGGVMTMLSLVVAFALSLPLSLAVGGVVGAHGLHVALPFHLSGLGVVGCIAVACFATAAACLGPAQRAASRPVRELIAYE